MKRRPLLVATQANHVDAARLLIERGADVNLADAQGMTPLAHAEQRGQRGVADLLRRAGASTRK